MLAFFSWYLVLSLAGWLAFPLAFRLAPALADRGYTFSRALGLLLWSYGFWLLCSLGILRNSPGGALVSLVLVLGLSVWALRSIDLDEFKDWIRSRQRMIVVSETLFLVAFAGWAVVRAANPEASGTEKPMELAFINAIIHSPAFPPHDPWLSGYAISYYYFGYVMVGLLAVLTNTSAGIAFNLGSALVFGLSALGSYGLVYNLLQAYNRSQALAGKSARIPAIRDALLGPLFLLIVSNLEGFFHSLHARGLFWRQDGTGAWSSGFWQWLDIIDLKDAPVGPPSWVPTNFWWWWRASRVIQDYDLAGNNKEIIDEFPFFSFLLADLHPHVLAIPFGLLAMALALNLILGGAQGKISWMRYRIGLRQLTWVSILAVPAGIGILAFGLLKLSLTLAFLGVVLMILSGFFLVYQKQNLPKLSETSEGSENVLLTIGSELHINPAYFLLLAVVLGGMAFLNTWDLPAYLLLAGLAYILPQFIKRSKPVSALVKELIWFGLALAVCSVILYLFFYLGFASQAGGILPNLIYPTRGAHFWLMFAPFLIALGAYLGTLVSQGSSAEKLRRGSVLATLILLTLWALSLLLGYLITIIPQVGDFYLSSLVTQERTSLFQAALQRRLVNTGGWLTMGVLLSLILGSMAFALRIGASHPDQRATVQDDDTHQPVHLFILLLVLLGTLLVTGSEFFYLRDQFGWRMNTIFKFYFQTWLLWSIAAAFAVAYVKSRLAGTLNLAFRTIMSLVLVMALFYPVLSLWNKTNGFKPALWTLDGSAAYRAQAPDDMAAIDWLSQAPAGVVAEAVPSGGGSYTQYARVSTFSGYPAVLGWMGHESQWRGGGEAMGSRQSDLERLYCGRDWAETQVILERYQIRYVFLGYLERAAYQAGSGGCSGGIVESKLINNLPVVFQSGQTLVFEYNGTTGTP